MNKRILSITLVLAMLVGMFTIVPMTVSADTNSNVWDGTTATSFAGGDGTENNPYQISNGAELALMSKLITVDNNSAYNRAYYKLTADIVMNNGDASTWKNSAPANKFTPIGTWSNANSSFGGTFDGNNKTISGLYVSPETGDNYGLFGCIQGGATIKNFALVNSYIYSPGGNVAAIAGTTDRSNEGDILVENIYTDAYVYSAGANAGGILGTLSNTTYNDSYTAGTVTVNKVVFTGTVDAGSKSYVGGIIADMRNVSVLVSDCLVAGATIKGNEYVSGLTSRSKTTEKVSGSTKDISNKGQTQTIEFNVVVGGTIDAATTNNDKGERAFVCSATGTQRAYAYDCYNATSLSTMRNADDDHDPNRLCYTISSELLYGSYSGENKIDWSAWTNWVSPENDVVRPAGIAASYVIMPSASFANGNGTEANPYKITNAEDLANLANLVNNNFENGAYRTAYYELTANITLTGDNNVAPIGSWNSAFGGTFNGNGYTISGVHIKNSGDGSGFFACIQGGATIKNLALVDAHVESTGLGAVGALVGQTDRANGGDITISNVYVDADVIVANGNEVAGIIGNLSDSNSSYTGGAVLMDNVVFNGSVKASGNYVAAFVGNARNISVDLTSCANYGTVTAGGKYVAGLIAGQKGGYSIVDCVSAGNVIGSSEVYAVACNNSADIYDDGERYIENTYYVNGIAKSGAVGNATADATAVANISKLFGNNATVPATFTKKAGDVAIPANCTVTPAILVGANMVNGAAVRMASPTGLRFTAVIGADYLNALVGDATDYSYGIIIAPTDYIAEANGTFTVEALKALSYEVSYKEIKAEKLQNDPTADGCYVFTGTLVNVQEENYTRNFSAIAYVKVGDTYYYSNYSEELNSRNIAEVASNACADTSAEQNEVYQYAMTEGEITVYSPYTEEQRKVLADFFQ